MHGQSNSHSVRIDEIFFIFVGKIMEVAMGKIVDSQATPEFGIHQFKKCTSVAPLADPKVNCVHCTYSYQGWSKPNHADHRIHVVPQGFVDELHIGQPPERQELGEVHILRVPG